MDFSDEELKEFSLEATELLDEAEESLLSLDDGGDFASNYDAIFRAFHSIKGAAGMMELKELQGHMHTLENTLTGCKEKNELTKEEADFFLRGVDGARQILQGGSYVLEELKSAGGGEASAEAAPPAPEPETAPAEPPAPAQQAAPTPKPKPQDKGRGKILIVDDEPEVKDILSEIVEEAGFKAVGFTDPAEAIEKVKEENPDVVLSDFSMPSMTGYDVLKAIHQYDPDLPVVFVSGHVTKDLLLDAIQQGIYGVIEKPFEEKRITELCLNAAGKYQTLKLLNRSVNLLMYQFSDLEEFLKKEGKTEVYEMIHGQVVELLENKRQLRSKKKSAEEKA